MKPESAEAARAALEICKEVGFSDAGIAEALPSRWGAELRAWLDAGRHGSMEYLARNVEERLDPRRILPEARSMVMVADQYAQRGDQSGANDSGETSGRIARYARGRDYHRVMKDRLHLLADRLRDRFPGESCRAFVDTAPVLEREHAARAGLGWVGKHTLLIHPRRGSYFFLGGVLTTVEMADERAPEADHCGTCTRCIDACPTRAIAPYSVDASRCISYLTIERRGVIDAGFHAAMGDWVFGCDVCQEVCPHNSPLGGERRAGGSTEAAAARPEYAPLRERFDLLGVLGWTEDDRRREFQGSALKRATLAMMKRNAIIAAGNLLARMAVPDLLGRIRYLAVDDSEPELVRVTARQVLDRFAGGGA